MDLKIPQSELGTKLDKKEKRRLTNTNTSVRGSVEQNIGRIRKPRLETMY
jgi:hypothetical protein